MCTGCCLPTTLTVVFSLPICKQQRPFDYHTTYTQIHICIRWQICAAESRTYCAIKWQTQSIPICRRNLQWVNAKRRPHISLTLPYVVECTEHNTKQYVHLIVFSRKPNDMWRQETHCGIRIVYGSCRTARVRRALSIEHLPIGYWLYSAAHIHTYVWQRTTICAYAALHNEAQHTKA